ncbi:MAG: hypothetical protein NZM09_12395 [Ignavibacterium sp.]|nr:hypothetical protein [Ignavibacterium sp.]MDW8376475.1 hypothetical protein [Ignavibacteriales bacterium]
MKKFIIFITLFLITFVIAQDKKKYDEIISRSSLDKTLGIGDRAAGIHNASNIGLFFENRGKLYPRRITQGPSGEFPINSTKHYIYRVNPWVGIPGNVVQGLHTTNEEWEAVGGYHNPDLAQIAFSDKPQTWHPTKGWPVKDAQGNNIFLSDQDSYCVFSDSNNSKEILGIQLIQTGYAYGVAFAKNILFYKYQLVGKRNLDSVYFAMYCDIDVGNVSGGVPEYADDKLDFNRSLGLVYFFDDGVSPEWPGGKTGFFGVAMLKTPKVNGVELGVTDMHYSLYDDDIDIDSVQFGRMASTPSLYNSSLGPRYFHLGNSTNLHFDDPATIPASGLDIVATISSGPYRLRVGDTLTFVIAFVAGETKEEMLAAATTAKNTVEAGFNLPKPPERPKLYGYAGDRQALLYWDDRSERRPDASSGEYDFEGYRIYRTINKGVTWEKIAEFDVKNDIGKNTGIQYSFIDTTIINGFEYWYSITAYDRGNNLVPSLEGPIGNDLKADNTIAIIPRSNAIGRQPVSAGNVNKIGNGVSNYELIVNPVDNENLAGGNYKVKFGYVAKTEIGNPATQVTITITDSTQTKPYKYGMKFNSPNNFDLLNLTTGETIRAGYNYPVGGRELTITGHGLRIRFTDAPGTPSDLRPQMGDLITVSFAVDVVKNDSIKVIDKRQFSLNQIQSTQDGVIFSLNKPSIIKSVSRIGGTDNFSINFTVSAETLVVQNIYIVSVEGNGVKDGKPFLIISVRVNNNVIQTDTVYNLGTFTFNGIQGKVTFSANAVPSAGNKFSVEVIKPVLPNIMDAYSFDVKGSVINKSAIRENLNKIKVVPNPYVVSSLFEPEFGELRREPLRQIQFINLPPECTIYIFTVDADLVKTIHHNSTSGTAVWDLRAEGGREIAPGIYIYVVKSGDIEYKERFAVIK